MHFREIFPVIALRGGGWDNFFGNNLHANSKEIRTMAEILKPTMFFPEVKSSSIRCIKAGLVGFIKGSPGLGKSAIAREIAAEGHLELIDMRLSQCTPEDLSGLPMRMGDKAVFTPFDMFPLINTPIPNGKRGWLLFLDEFNSGAKSVQAAAYKLVLDKMVGNHKLHPQVAMLAAGNLETDNAIVNRLSTAMQSRLIHMTLEPSMKHWMSFANTHNIDYRILAFLEFRPSKFYDFKPDHQDSTFACPRTWEFLSLLIQGESNLDGLLALLAGTVGAGVAMEFVTFCREFGKLPTLSEILADPINCRIPNEISTLWACIMFLVENTNLKNVKDLIQYVGRFSPEHRVIYFRSITQRFTELRDEPAVSKEMMQLMVFLNA